MIKFIKQRTCHEINYCNYQRREFFIGTIKEIPAVVSQGISIEDAKANVIDALKLYLEDMQQENSFDNTVLEEDLTFGQCLLKETNSSSTLPIINATFTDTIKARYLSAPSY